MDIITITISFCFGLDMGSKLLRCTCGMLQVLEFVFVFNSQSLCSGAPP